MHKNKFFSKHNRQTLLISGILTTLNLLFLVFFNLNTFSFENRPISPLVFSTSLALYILYIVFCIFMRTKRLTNIAKGIFLYQLIGAFAFSIYFVCFIFNIGFQTIPYNIFHAWTVMLEPFTVLFARISGIAAKYITAMLYLLLTYITGKTVTAIKKDISYEKKYKEDHNIT